MDWKQTSLALGMFLALFAAAAAAQQVKLNEAPSWAPKPIGASKYVPPHRPHPRLVDLKSKHDGVAHWRELLVDDDHLHAEYVSTSPGSRVSKRFHPDTREWWIVMDGEIRFEIEGQQPFVATSRSMIQVPMQTVYSMETVGDKPALRLEVNIAQAKTLYPQ